jgi:hypothetical protein
LRGWLAFLSLKPLGAVAVLDLSRILFWRIAIRGGKETIDDDY